MENKNSIKGIIDRRHNFRLKLVFESIGAGAVASLVVILYRLLLERADTIREGAFEFLKHNSPLYIALWFIGLIIIGIILGVLIKVEPMICGSGIPQVKGVLLRQLKMNWIKVILGKLLGGVLAIGTGLSLGREGPSVQLGAATGQGVSRSLKCSKLEERYLITCGASAGLAAAFNAPLAGAIFVLEEIHKNFSPLIMTSAMAASLTADFISKEVFGTTPIFNFKLIEMLPLNKYFYLLIFGIILGAFGSLFNKSLVRAQELYKNKKLPPILKPVIPVVTAGVLGFLLPEVLGGGHKLIMDLSSGSFTLLMMLLLLIVKFLFTMLSYGSGAPGGIFFPLLAIGALSGGIYGSLLVKFFNIDPIYINNFIIIGMAGYFTAIVKAPITGSILITEMTGSFTHLLALATVSVTAYVITDMLESKPIYETLLERILISKGKNSFVGDESNKVILEATVAVGSIIDGKEIKNIVWPKYCLVVGLKRGEIEIIPKGTTRIFSGDTLIVLTGENYAPKVKLELLEMSKEQS